MTKEGGRGSKVGKLEFLNVICSRRLRRDFSPCGIAEKKKEFYQENASFSRAAAFREAPRPLWTLGPTKNILILLKVRIRCIHPPFFAPPRGRRLSSRTHARRRRRSNASNEENSLLRQTAREEEEERPWCPPPSSSFLITIRLLPLGQGISAAAAAPFLLPFSFLFEFWARGKKKRRRRRRRRLCALAYIHSEGKIVKS